MTYDFITADVFTDRIFGGNQLAVFPRAEGLSDAQMQQITIEFNLSETVFVLPPDDPNHTCRLRIFTPARELPFAGHPTIGAAHVLSSLGMIGDGRIVFEEGVGPVEISFRGEDAWLSTPRMPEFGPTPPSAGDIATMLSLDEADIRRDELSPQFVSCGVPFLFVPVRDRNAAARARVNETAWSSLLGDAWAQEILVLATDPERTDSDIRARMFAPGLGIREDPATGAAAAAMTGYLGSREADTGSFAWTIEQGFEMGRPSILKIETEKRDGVFTVVRVGGRAVEVSRGQMHVPSL